MSIDFIPNDPKAQGTLPIRKVTPRPDRPSARAHFDVAGPVPEAQYAVGTPEFLFWQCREAALAAAEIWEVIHGPFTSWHERKTLAVFPDLGEDLNAFYDRKRGGQPECISFFHQKVGGKTYLSGASTDVVAHESGHAFLDAIRPDFWASSRFEVNAFHEAFGDCVAILTALNDKASRTAILATLTKKNPLESTAEELAEGIRKLIPGHNAGEPRHARNSFQWGPPGSIPIDGGPGVLIFEEHSFGQIFSGCFYDTIVNIFKDLGSPSEARLLKAAKTAGTLLVAATKQAPQRAQYFREVGQAMILNDEQVNNGANGAAIRDGFQAHGIALAASVMLAPQAALPGTARAAAVSGKTKIAAATRNALLKTIGAGAGARLTQSVVNIAGEPLREVVHQRSVPLDRIDKKLKGVVAFAPQVALVGRAHAVPAIVGHVSNAEATIQDVEKYVQSLVEHGRIGFKADTKPLRGRGARRAAIAQSAKGPRAVTHEVREIRGQKTLVRIRFACRHA